MTGTRQVLFGQEAISLRDGTPTNVTLKAWHTDNLSPKQSISFWIQWVLFQKRQLLRDTLFKVSHLLKRD